MNSTCNTGKERFAENKEKNTEAIYHAEDPASKYAAFHFGKEITKKCGIEGEIEVVTSTENVGIEVRQSFEDFNYRMENGKLADLMFTPLMSGEMPQKERVMESLKLLNREYASVTSEDRKRMQAVLYVFSSKFLTTDEMKEVKEAFSMNPLGQMIFDDGVQSGLARGRAEGKAESVLFILQNVGDVTKELSEKSERSRAMPC